VTDLDIDIDVLRETGTALRVVATEFEHANDRSDDAADATGHDGLADRVREFAHNWDDRRAKMLENIAFLAEAGVGIGDTFADIESELVGCLRGDS
jgi:hypothetical protein